MKARQGVGQWGHYRTTDGADGLETSDYYEGKHYRAKLYWAPSDFTDAECPTKRAYLVMWVSPSGHMNMYGRYEDEVSAATYLGDERTRRNWKELCGIAATLPVERMRNACENAIKNHKARLAEGYTYRNGFYSKAS